MNTTTTTAAALAAALANLAADAYMSDAPAEKVEASNLAARRARRSSKCITYKNLNTLDGFAAAPAYVREHYAAAYARYAAAKREREAKRA